MFLLAKPGSIWTPTGNALGDQPMYRISEVLPETDANDAIITLVEIVQVQEDGATAVMHSNSEGDSPMKYRAKHRSKRKRPNQVLVGLHQLVDLTKCVGNAGSVDFTS